MTLEQFLIEILMGIIRIGICLVVYHITLSAMRVLYIDIIKNTFTIFIIGYIVGRVTGLFL